MLPKNNHAVIYNTEEQVGLCPDYVFKDKKLGPCVHTNIVITREELKDLFYLYDVDHIHNTNKYGEALLDKLHKELLKGVSNDKVLDPKIKKGKKSQESLRAISIDENVE